MKIDFRSGELCLTNNQPLRLEEARGRVVCTAGVIWITVDGEAGDTFLHPGQSHIISCDGLALIESIGKLLCAIAGAAIGLIVVSSQAQGAMSGWSLLALGLCNSIMFPTIFTPASEGLGARAAEGSGVICVAIVGGAIVPPLTGLLADFTDLRTALFLPAACYLVIASFGVYARLPATAGTTQA